MCGILVPPQKANSYYQKSEDIRHVSTVAGTLHEPFLSIVRLHGHEDSEVGPLVMSHSSITHLFASVLTMPSPRRDVRNKTNKEGGQDGGAGVRCSWKNKVLTLLKSAVSV